jgi:deoxyribodipyrimidine photolyase-related protein
MDAEGMHLTLKGDLPMSESAAVVFPPQLFLDHPSLSTADPVFLVEEDRYFSDFLFHKKKILLHVASMDAYAGLLGGRGFEVIRIPHEGGRTLFNLFAALNEHRVSRLRVAEICDTALEHRLRAMAGHAEIEVVEEPSPAFLTPRSEIEAFFEGKEHFLMASFYRHQRKTLGILMENGKPAGGKWSYDVLNRRPLPREVSVPPLPASPEHPAVVRGKQRVQEEFAANPGSVDGFFYPVTHEDAERWLDHFLAHRLSMFGAFEDAMREEGPFLYHSLLSPLLNTGLLVPAAVVERTLAFAGEHEVPLNSLEGFIRQIIGWREFMRAVYILRGEEERRRNFWGHRRPMPEACYSATTGIGPLDCVVRRVHRYAYAHHIERLMVLGNFMNLCGIHPDAIYRWFMELFIDAYDWVMVPNVYGMSLYADGGLITTKPYISGSHYLMKMGDFPSGEWRDVWDALFWRFLEVHREVFAANPRMRVLLGTLDRMDRETLERHRTVAEGFLASLFGEWAEGGDR